MHAQGDVLLVADEFDDGWMRGLRLDDLEVRTWNLYYWNYYEPTSHLLDWVFPFGICGERPLSYLQDEVSKK